MVNVWLVIWGILDFASVNVEPPNHEVPAALCEYEETVDSKKRLNKDRVWVVDPLDGTKEFIEGVPHFVVSVALVENGEPILGVLYNPVTTETFTAVKGQGAMLDGEKIKCSEKEKPDEMVIFNSRSETRSGLWDPFQDTFKELKGIGAVAYKLGLTAAGRAEFVPIASNETAEGRSANRRIEMILSPNLDDLFKLLEE